MNAYDEDVREGGVDDVLQHDDVLPGDADDERDAGKVFLPDHFYCLRRPSRIPKQQTITERIIHTLSCSLDFSFKRTLS